MKPVAEMTQAELAAYVQGHLRDKGIEVVLSGGAVVAIYSDGEYVSEDIDLVNARGANPSQIEEAMIEIGFSRTGRHFEHSDTEYYVEFPPGPLTVGVRIIDSLSEIEFDTGTLRVLSPLECVLDRLAHFYHWGDRQALVQARMVASRHQIDLGEVEKWSEAEGKHKEFREIRELLEQ